MLRKLYTTNMCYILCVRYQGHSYKLETWSLFTLNRYPSRENKYEKILAQIVLSTVVTGGIRQKYSMLCKNIIDPNQVKKQNDLRI